MDNFLQLELRHTGETLRIRRVRDSQGQTVLAIDGTLPPRASGPPLHVHFLEREEVMVKAGTLGAQIGNEKVVVPAGGSAAFPAGAVHKWWNAGDDLLELSGRAIPAVDLDRFLQALFAVLNASATGRPSIFYMAHVLSRHRHTQAIMVIHEPFSGLFFLWCCWSAVFLANIAEQAGPVRLSRARVRRNSHSGSSTLGNQSKSNSAPLETEGCGTRRNRTESDKIEFQI